MLIMLSELHLLCVVTLQLCLFLILVIELCIMQEVKKNAVIEDPCQFAKRGSRPSNDSSPSSSSVFVDQCERLKKKLSQNRVL